MTTFALRAEQALLPDGWARDVTVRVDGGRIVAVGGEGGRPVGVLLPAPVNLHSHAFQRAMAGMTERRGTGDDSFWTWRTLMYRFLEHLTPEDVEAIAAMVQVEMAEAGYAAVCEFHYLHHGSGGVPYANRAEMAQRVVAAAGVTGLGLTLLPVLYMQGGCDGRALAGGQLRFFNDLEGFQGVLEGISGLPGDGVVGVAPHSLRAVPPGALRQVAGLQPGAPVHIHAAEQQAEVAEVLAFHGRRPVELLLDHGIDARWCLIHATQMTPEETVALAATGAVAGLCPITEGNLGDGVFDGVRFAGAGGRFGVGSDSNVLISLTEELRLFEYGQRMRDHGRAVMAAPGASTGRALYEAVLAGGAQAAGRDSGGIAPGKWADLVALDAGSLALEGRVGDDLLDSWIFATSQSVVTDTWSAGRHVVQGGRHVARAAVEAAFRKVMARLRGVM
ncbi:MAG: formimidoylglutamate deiminase [Gemmobacter sp.]